MNASDGHCRCDVGDDNLGRVYLEFTTLRTRKLRGAREAAVRETITIRQADPADPQVAALIARHIAYGDAHYAAESNHHLSIADHAALGVTLWAAWQGVRCLGMAGMKPFTAQDAELKSMHVLDTARGAGVGRALVVHVMADARLHGVTHLWLETGSRDASAAARRLYERLGFAYCAPFAHYRPDPESVFMTCAL